MNEPLRSCPLCGTEAEGLDLGLRDYRWVSEALPARVSPTDIDLVLERKGRVLVLEFKQGGSTVPTGQRLTLRTFVRAGFDVWVVWEDSDGHASVGVMDRDGEVYFVEKHVPVGRLRHRVADWFEQASKEG